MDNPLIRQYNRVLKIKHKGHRKLVFGKTTLSIDPREKPFSILRATRYNTVCIDCSEKVMEFYDYVSRDYGPFDTYAWHIAHHTLYHPLQCYFCNLRQTLHNDFNCKNIHCPMHSQNLKQSLELVKP